MKAIFQGRKRVIAEIIYAMMITATLFSHSKIFAAESTPFFRGVRAQGMGGAAIATVNDETALFLNPAGLGKLRGGYIALVNPTIETNFDTQAAIGADLSSLMAVMDPQQMVTLARRNPGRPMHYHIQLQPTFVTTNFAIGVLAKYTADSEYTQGGNISYNYINDYALALGYCFRLLEGRLKIGVTAKFINRATASTSVNPSTTGLTLPPIASEGIGWGYDVGVIMTAPWAWLPTLSVVARDIGNTRFNLGNGYFFGTSNRPADLLQSVDAAIAIFPYDGKTTRYSVTVEYRDALTTDPDMYRKIHAGMEINFADFLYLRAGMNQRYYTAGLELAFDRQQLQIATYGEEIGTYPSFREDRRFILNYGFRF